MSDRMWYAAGSRHSILVGVVEWDGTLRWRCPLCRAWWDIDHPTQCGRCEMTIDFGDVSIRKDGHYSAKILQEPDLDMVEPKRLTFLLKT